jgi:hypothetical protein
MDASYNLLHVHIALDWNGVERACAGYLDEMESNIAIIEIDRDTEGIGRRLPLFKLRTY